MKKVILLNDKLKFSAEQKAVVLRKQKIMAMRKVFQCTQCASKCERCGISLGPDNSGHGEHPQTPYHFCSGCAEEYGDYIDRLQGKNDPDTFWHNHEWMKIWQVWIEYQGAVDQYLRSKEFRRLLEELDPEDLKC